MLNIEDSAATLVLEQNRQNHGKRSGFYLVPNANHAMHNDNPKDLSEMILKDLNEDLALS